MMLQQGSKLSGGNTKIIGRKKGGYSQFKTNLSNTFARARLDETHNVAQCALAKSGEYLNGGIPQVISPSGLSVRVLTGKLKILNASSGANIPLQAHLCSEFISLPIRQPISSAGQVPGTHLAS